MFQAIAAMSENRVIGANGRIPWHLPDDFRWFKHKTMGGTLIMGRKTFESIGRPLPGRRTIVVTRSDFSAPGIEVVHELDGLAKQNDCWVCGGAEIYRQLLPQCWRLYLTRVRKEIEGDTLMPTFEDEFAMTHVLYETPEFRVESWCRRGWTTYSPAEEWPLPS
jgi:dihydrofolate reductase